jgi:hypothetical protein
MIPLNCSVEKRSVVDLETISRGSIYRDLKYRNLENDRDVIVKTLKIFAVELTENGFF